MIRGVVVESGSVARITPEIIAKSRRILAAESALMAGYVRREHMSGPRPERVAVRTGNLRSSVKAVPAQDVPGWIHAGINFGTQYARTHVGPRGQVTTIRPVNRKFLTIPLEGALTKSGVSRGSALSGAWGEIFFARSKKGSLILFGKRVVSKGKGAGEARGNVIPLFLLVKQVRIKARIHPEDILAWEKPHMIEAFRGIGIDLKG